MRIIIPPVLWAFFVEFSGINITPETEVTVAVVLIIAACLYTLFIDPWD